MILSLVLSVHAHAAGSGSVSTFTVTRPSSPVAVMRLPDGAVAIGTVQNDTPGIVMTRGRDVEWVARWKLRSPRYAFSSVADRLFIVGTSNEGATVGEIWIAQFDRHGSSGPVRVIRTDRSIDLVGAGAAANRDGLWIAGSTIDSFFVITTDADLTPVSQLGLLAGAGTKFLSAAAVLGGGFAVAGVDPVGCIVARYSKEGTLSWARRMAQLPRGCSHVATESGTIAAAAPVSDPDGVLYAVFDENGDIAAAARTDMLPLIESLSPGRKDNFLLSGRLPGDGWTALLGFDRRGRKRMDWRAPLSSALYAPLSSNVVAGTQSLIFGLDDQSFARVDVTGDDLEGIWEPLKSVGLPRTVVNLTVEKINLRRKDRQFTAAVRPPPRVLRLKATPAAPDLAVTELDTTDWIGGPLALPTGPYDPPDSIVDETQPYKAKAASMFLSGSWSELDAAITEAVSSDHRHSTGGRAIYSIHDGLSIRAPALKGISEEDYLARLDAWQRANPESHAPAILRAAAWRGLAWEARGGGLADTVSEEGWEQFRQYMTLAERELQRLEPARPDNPVFYTEYTSVLGPDGPQFESIYRKAARRYQDDTRLHHTYINYLTPQWGGTSRRVKALFDFLLTELEPGIAEEMYAAVVLRLSIYLEYDYAEVPVNKETFFRGLTHQMQRFPESRALAYRIAAVACEEGRKDLAAELFRDRRLAANDALMSAFRTDERYALCRQWALTEAPAPPNGADSWASVLFMNDARLEDGSAATGFTTYLVNSPDGIAGLTSAAPLIHPDSARGYTYLEQPEEWTIRSVGAPYLAASVSKIRTRDRGRTLSNAIVLEVENGTPGLESVALDISPDDVPLYSTVWVVGPEGKSLDMGIVQGGRGEPTNLSTIRIRLRGPANALRAVGNPVVDDLGRVIGTIVAARDEYEWTAELVKETIEISLLKPIPSREPGSLESASAREPAGMARNIWILEDLVWEWTDSLTPGKPMISLVVGDGRVSATSILDDSLPDDFKRTLSSAVGRLEFPPGPAAKFSLATDRNWDIIVPRSPVEEKAPYPAGPPSNIEVVGSVFDKWRTELGSRVVTMKIDIDESGTVIGCEITDESLPPAFRTECCEAVLKLSYPPGPPALLTLKLVATR